ncbi:MAG TPA: phosphatase PAP2 family protein [Ruminiclostridium sp.]|jgi:diacylglycerol kinase (ATP)|uniref:Diacylglycerol kinase n=1 Tax=Acetivibrio saccincola TaxID=1677857 RepID=A0A2K9EB92_9FIRM|nr:diacylglycerol kinase [Acetivibrio saccincola]AUG57424.1 Undecaprenol kinase [Acetivibrio saccincola]NLW27436.1 phosphatase PAP2 family protein [Acetivibrio saccincola]PQQ67350.1 diacylglycerol kinase [Acetivibrio saccincola]HAA43451.1 phosphatase PAP2 family protein [Ruminiclostridium sp.]
MKNKNLSDSFNNAIKGIIYVIKSERNMKIHVAVSILVLFMSLFLDLTKLEFIVICFSIGMVMTAEIFNTAIEEIVDLITTGYHPKIRIIKDVAAGGVLVASFISLIIGYFIFFDRVSTGLEIGVERIRQYPMHIAVIASVITIVIVLVIKSFSPKYTPLKGGMPSGHAAIASSITTAVALWSSNINLTILCLILLFLVVQSRIESKIHNFMEVFVGTIIGFIVTLFLFSIFHKP